MMEAEKIVERGLFDPTLFIVNDGNCKEVFGLSSSRVTNQRNNHLTMDYGHPIEPFFIKIPDTLWGTFH